MGKLSFRPRSYQIVPLVMALKQEVVRLLIADDVGVGKTVEALIILQEMLERGEIKRFAVVCPPHLCEQWQKELRDKLDIEAEIIRSSTAAALDRKLVLVASTAQTLLDLRNHERSLRVEWYIVALIVAEIALTLYELFLHPH